MKITFVSNYLTIHQIPFCELMYRELGANFCFVNTEEMETERIMMGWSNEKRLPFEIDLQQSGDLINESDIVIFGSSNDSLIQYRLKNNKPVIRYSERILKDGRWHILSPRAIRNMVKSHTIYRNKNVWLLCAGAYVAGDYGLFGAYLGKSFKWGYFPETRYSSEEHLFEKKNNSVPNLLWCGRMLSWKHPELAVLVAKHLREKSIPFHMDIIGDGKLKSQIQSQIDAFHLEDYVTLQGFINPEIVRTYMERTDIFLFTSDFHEGWGAVLNEAMNSGCACVVSHAIGAAPYLIDDGKNGLLYKNGETQQLLEKVELLIKDLSLRKNVGLNAYHTIVDTWNAELATKRIIAFCRSIIQQEAPPIFQDGPISKAFYLSNNWYH